MQQSAEGVTLTELIEKLDTQLEYGGSRKISELEAGLLDQLDESYVTQIKMKENLAVAQRGTEKARENLKKTEAAVDEYCSEITRKKILLARGWQFSEEETQKIKEALSDKEIVKQRDTKRRYKYAINC